MPNSLSLVQINQLQAELVSGEIDGVYSALEKNGYSYAGWAAGVANGDTLAGVVAVDFLSGTAMMGIGSFACQNLTPEQIQNIKVGMAAAYLNTLSVIAKASSDGLTKRDIDEVELTKIHADVFQKNGLSIDNWTLHAPFEILRKLGGDDAVEQYWKFMRDSKGADNYQGIAANLSTLAFMHKQTGSSDPSIRQLAQIWMNNVPGIYDWDQINRSVDLFYRVALIKSQYSVTSVLDVLSFNEHATSLDGDYDQLGNFITSLQNQFQVAKTTLSPLVLDLDGDGVETISKSAGIHFDHDGNHFAETTGWVGKDDGLLVWDKNGNGAIDNGGELFGNNTFLNDGSKAANGFAALADLDNNHDGKLDASDSAFTQLRLWKDSDSDAALAESEWLTLDTAGVRSIAVNYKVQSLTDAQGNQHLQAGTFTRIDGTTRAVDDVWFAVDMARTLDQDKLEISNDIAALPELFGFGNVHSLHQAMARDTSSHLKSLVAILIGETTVDIKRAMMTNLLYAWAGVEDIDPASRAVVYGNVIGDARKLATLESFLGEGYLGTWCWGTRDPNPHASASPILLKAFDQLADYYLMQFLDQTQFQSLYNSIALNWDVTTDSFTIDVNALLESLHFGFENNEKNGIDSMIRFGKILRNKGGFGEELLKELRQRGDLAGSAFDRNLVGLGMNLLVGDSAMNSVVADLLQENMMFGLDGNDCLTGGNLSDILIGGKDNDILSGGNGCDVYRFTKGDGNDSINESDATKGIIDTVEFLDVASTELMALQLSGCDLILQYGASDQLSVKNYFSNPNCSIEEFIFADDVRWNDAAIKARVINLGTAGSDYLYGYDDGTNRIAGLEGNDTLYGGAKDDQIDGGNGNDYLFGLVGNDTLIGGAGDDNIEGGAGNDILNGGIGNDAISGGAGNDTYLFTKGDGSDKISEVDTASGNVNTIRLLDVASTELRALLRIGNDLILKYGDSDQLTIGNYFNMSNDLIYMFAFADSVNWDVGAIKARVITVGAAGPDNINGYNDESNRIHGFDGDDSLYGGGRDDQIDGGNGNDSLFGNAGNDTLKGGTGNDVLNGCVGNDTYLFAKGDGSDRITELDYSNVNVDTVQFLDVASTEPIVFQRSGNDLVLKYSQADQLTISNYFTIKSYRNVQFSYSDGMCWDDALIKAQVMTVGTAGPDVIAGYDDGSNRIAGLDGNDRLYGGSKDDQIDGGNGNDSLTGLAGNDALLGGSGDDSLDGGVGNDILNGGLGNDSLIGGAGNDTYLFARGDGSDRITELDYSNSNIDIVQFLDVASTELTALQRNGEDLVLKFNGSDQLIVRSYFSSTYSRIEQFNFADGVSLDDAAIKARVMTVGTAGTDTINGYDDGSNRIAGQDGNDSLNGGSKDDQIDGGNGNDYLLGYGGNDTLTGGLGNDSLRGGAGADTLTGGAGNDILNGEQGNDLYLISKGDGVDTISEEDAAAGNVDTVQFTDLTTADVSSIERQNDALILKFGATDQLTVSYYFNRQDYRIEQFSFADGVNWDDAAIKAQVNTLGSAVNNILNGYNDGSNRIFGLDGDDTIAGGAKDDFLDGGNGRDGLNGYVGNDVLLGQAGVDYLSDSAGNNLFDGGADNDVLIGGSGNEFFFGGTGDDVITPGSGADILAFNLGDGNDTIVASSGKDNTLSFGKGINAADLRLSKSGNDLRISTSATDKVTLKDWYASTDKQSVATIEFLSEETQTQIADATSSLPAPQFEQYAFASLVRDFEQSLMESPWSTETAFSRPALDRSLSSRAATGFGGELAFQYAAFGGLSTMPLSAAQSQLTNLQFGLQSQPLQTSTMLGSTNQSVSLF